MDNNLCTVFFVAYEASCANNVSTKFHFSHKAKLCIGNQMCKLNQHRLPCIHINCSCHVSPAVAYILYKLLTSNQLLFQHYAVQAALIKASTAKTIIIERSQKL